MRVLMTGGGTGGHIYPAIAIADKIKARFPDAEILFAGTVKGMERDLVPAAGYEIKFITVSGFDRKHLVKNVKTVHDLRKGMHEAARVIKEFKPDVVIGTGGYVCGPVVLQAHKRRIRSFIHEQNAFPGITNLLLSRNVEKVFLSFEEAKKYFKINQYKMDVTGNPIRQAFFETERETSRAAIGAGDEFSVLCFGGSLGADRINKTVLEMMKTFKDDDGFRLYFITGRRYFKEISEKVEAMGLSGIKQLKLLPYAENMYDYMKGCDMAICRSGALTVSEITASGIPAIMIPSPNVTGNHQYHNARVVADRGGAFLVEEKDLTSEELIRLIRMMMNSEEGRQRMSDACASLAQPDAAGIICDTIWP